MRVKDKIALVSGGASGIGRSTSHCLAKEGAKVIVADINLEEANKVVKEIKELGHEAVAVRVDATRIDEVDQMIKFSLDKFGRIDILVNIVGGSIPGKIGPFSQSSKDVWDALIQLNFYSTLICTRAVINHMIERRSGKIINMASVSGILGQADNAVYAAAKAAVIAFTKSLAKEVAKYGINVNCLSPASTETPRWQRFSEEYRREIIKPVHLGRPGRPEESANVVLFLASDEASFMIGANVSVDGGVSLGA